MVLLMNIPIYFLFFPLFFLINSETGIVHRQCSNRTVSDDVSFASFSCTFQQAYVAGNSQHVQIDVADICESCTDRDGCNRASGYGPTIMMIASSMAIIKILLF